MFESRWCTGAQIGITSFHTLELPVPDDRPLHCTELVIGDYANMHDSSEKS